MAETAIELIQEGKDITTHLTDTEKFNLERCERIIKDGLNTFLHVGSALAQIRDNRLYRETHDTFEKYCKDVWDLGKSTAYQKIDGYRAVTLLEGKMSAMADKNNNDSEQPKVILPTNERQTRPLTKLAPDAQVEAWRLVLEQLNEGKKLTAALVNKVVKQVRGETAKKKKLEIKKAVEKTTRLSKQFKNAHQIMLEVIEAEKNAEWTASKRTEVIKWLEALVKRAKSDD